jgi:pimeloyl-ACP methyl ester carboxylesterase
LTRIYKRGCFTVAWFAPPLTRGFDLSRIRELGVRPNAIEDGAWMEDGSVLLCRCSNAHCVGLNSRVDENHSKIGLEQTQRDIRLSIMNNEPMNPNHSAFKTSFTRRGAIYGIGTMMGLFAFNRRSGLRAMAEQTSPSEGTGAGPYTAAVLPAGIRSRFVSNVNGIRFHVLEAGFETPGRPAVVLLHGFPELAYSWRKVMPAVASDGFHVIAPDLRGYGRTSESHISYDEDFAGFRTCNEVRDIVALVSAFGYRSVAAVVGHDYGSPLAAWCALIRPDVFRSVVLMSAPFGGPPTLPFDIANLPEAQQNQVPPPDHIYADLAALVPPRKHYQRYYATREANPDIWKASQGVHDFLRAYCHMKSADWKQNKPFELKSWSAEELAKVPRYYIMDLDKGMAETVAPEMPSLAEASNCKWLTDEELRVYSSEYGRTGFQGGLNGYRIGMDPQNTTELRIFSGRTIDVPSLFIAGKSDWGVYQRPGAFETMQTRACTKMRGAHLVDGAGHWVQQEQADAVNRLLIEFLANA